MLTAHLWPRIGVSLDLLGAPLHSALFLLRLQFSGQQPLYITSVLLASPKWQEEFMFLTCEKIYKHPSVNCNIIYNSQDMEAT